MTRIIRQDFSAESTRKSTGYLKPICVALLLLAVASATYLSYLYIKVHSSTGNSGVDAFCNISERFNCTKVSLSHYATFLAIPNAFLGLQYYLVALIVYFAFRKTQILRPILLLYMLIGLPNVIYLAYVSITELKTICLMCAVLYLCHLSTIALLIISMSRDNSVFGMLARSLSDLGRHKKTIFALGSLSLVGLSQFFWMPSLLATNDILSTNDPSISQSAPGSSEIHIDSLDHETLYISGTKIGKPTAPLQVIGYSDFQCPLCKKAHIPLFQVIKEHPEKIHFIHKDYPLDEKCNRKISGSFHNQACAAAFFVRCAKKFDRFFELSASLFHTSETMDNEYLAQVASAHGLSSEAMQNCMSQPSIKDAIAEDIESGLELGLQGTPTFIVNGKMITGARDRNWWLAAIDGRIDDK